MTKLKEEFKPKRILLPTDLSEGSLVALKKGLDLANRFKSQVDVLTVFEEFPQDIYGDVDYFNDGMVRRVKEQIHHALEKIKMDECVRKGIRISIRKGPPGKQILMASKKNFNDLIIMATHGRVGFDHFRYGSVTEEIVKTSKTSVLSIKPFKENTIFNPKTVLIPIDFSSRDLHALKYAKKFKGSFNSKINVIHVIPEFSSETFSLKLPKSLLKESKNKVIKTMKRAGLSGSNEVCFGDPADTILEKAENLESDLILIPARDKSSKLSGLLGSVSSKMVRYADCDVLTLHPK